MNDLEQERLDTEISKKHEEIGLHATILIDLHLNNPKNFTRKIVMDRLIEKYEELGLNLIKKDNVI
jgi:diphthamide biosynthesis methyltransferase